MERLHRLVGDIFLGLDGSFRELSIGKGALASLFWGFVLSDGSYDYGL